jgi:hypothetical protein
MKSSLLVVVTIAIVGSSSSAQVVPVVVDAGLPPGSERTLLVAPHLPARMFGWGGTEVSTVFDIYVQEMGGEGEFECTIEGPGVSGVDELVIEHIGGGVIFSSATFPCAVATDQDGLGVFDFAILRGGGRSLSNHYLKLSVPDREYCGYGLAVQITSPDLNGDLAINLADLTVFSGAYFADLSLADLNGDSQEDLGDLSLFSQAYLTR